MSNAHTGNQEVSLYSSVQENGIFFNLISADYTSKNIEHLFWKTSYPFLEFLYPHWWTHKDKQLKPEFWWESLRHAEELFKWSIADTNKLLRIPMESFGAGISNAWIVEHAHSKEPLVINQQDNVYNRKLSGIDINQAFSGYLSEFKDKVVLLVINFFSVDIHEFTPKAVANSVTWEYKSTRVAFSGPTEFLERIVSKRFLSFLATDMSEEQVFNTIMNYLYWKSATTSSDLVKDIFRGIFTELLAELTEYTEIAQTKRGNIFITGELPSFLADKAYTELMCVDGLGISGAWSMYVDTYALLLPMLLKTSETGKMPLTMILPSSDTWMIPKKVGDRDIIKVMLQSREYLATSGNIFRYKVDTFERSMEMEVSNETLQFELPSGMKLKTLVIDSRKWPVVYGPHPTSNMSKVPLWINRLKTFIS